MLTTFFNGWSAQHVKGPMGCQPWPISPQATRLATLEARKDASKSLEKKVLQKAMEDAKVRGC